MALELGKKLNKGERINLTKNVDDSNSEKVNNICMGANWGAIVRKGGWFSSDRVESVDLDATVLLYDSNKTKVGEVSFRNLRNSNNSICHSGDDRKGDIDGDDGLDNEIIKVDLSRVPSNVSYIVFILNSYSMQNFAEIPYARLRIYEGTPTKVNNVLASYEANNMNGLAIVLGHMYRKDGWWKFKADGICSSERSINEIAAGTAINVL
jgi:tellurium resistance protein TerZ